MPESPGVEKHDKEKEHRESKKGRGLLNTKYQPHKVDFFVFEVGFKR